ncbi:MAG: Rieske 2Fe-2S domain-containing protein [Candidatus Marsarchaeota archaeon]|nr:Rieske 2Fe-2S domain-containing protein [Candidatus Marsarchaeota archaeon]MCL5413158.1 Rieske 2Fe-2S domain-containing protein [Candidatus Marsarchaeota archaeon]
MEYNTDKKVSDIGDNGAMSIKVGGKPIALVKYNGRVYALDGKCTHKEGPLGEGRVDNGRIVCPWHSGAFDITTGKAEKNTPWVTNIGTYKIRVEGATGEIFVEM